MSKEQYLKKNVGPNLYSWQPARPSVGSPSFMVEETADEARLVGVIPKGLIKDKVALKKVAALYPDRSAVFHKDYATVKREQPL